MMVRFAMCLVPGLKKTTFTSHISNDGENFKSNGGTKQSAPMEKNFRGVMVVVYDCC